MKRLFSHLKRFSFFSGFGVRPTTWIDNWIDDWIDNWIDNWIVDWISYWIDNLHHITHKTDNIFKTRQFCATLENKFVAHSFKSFFN